MVVWCRNPRRRLSKPLGDRHKNLMAQTTKKRRWYLLGAILATLHTALCLLVFLLVVLSEDTEAGMLFYIFVLIDFPIGIGLLSSENPLPLLIFGGMLWFFYGFIIQSLIRLAYIGGLASADRRPKVPGEIEASCSTDVDESKGH